MVMISEGKNVNEERRHQRNTEEKQLEPRYQIVIVPHPKAGKSPRQIGFQQTSISIGDSDRVGFFREYPDSGSYPPS
jgi:hypothetical protein